MNEPSSTGANDSGRRVMVRFGALVMRLPRYVRLATRLARDPRVPLAQRAVLLGGAAYAVSPVCLVPGKLDDLAVLLLALRQIVRNSPPDVLAEHLRQTGISAAAIDADLATVRATAVLVARKTSRVAARAVGRLIRAGAGATGSARRRLGTVGVGWSEV